MSLKVQCVFEKTRWKNKSFEIRKLFPLFLGGKIDAKAAAALIAAAASGGDPDIANKIIEKMLAGTIQ